MRALQREGAARQRRPAGESVEARRRARSRPRPPRCFPPAPSCRSGGFRSLFASPRAKASTASVIACISASVSRIFALASSSSMNSARQPQAGDRRAEIVGDRRQHGGAVADEALQPLAHAVEGDVGAARLLRAGLRQRLEAFAAAEPVGGARRAAASAGSRGGCRTRRPSRPPSPRSGTRRGTPCPAEERAGDRRQAFSQRPSSSCIDRSSQRGIAAVLLVLFGVIVVAAVVDSRRSDGGPVLARC